MSEKLCTNCWMPKSLKAFHATANGHTDVCRACAYTVSRSRDTSPFNVVLAEFDRTFPGCVSQVRREIEKYNASFLSGHWEVCILYLGRVSEALVFALADVYQLESRLPRNINLSKIEQSQASIRNRLSEAMARGEMTDAEVISMQRELKALVNAALDLNSDLSQFEVPSDSEDSKDYKFVVKSLEKLFIRKGQHAAAELLRSSINPRIRDIMDARNRAAHSPFKGKRKTIRKRHVLQLSELLGGLIADLSTLPAVEDLSG